MSFGTVFLVVVFTCTWTNLRLVQGPAKARPVWRVHSLHRPMIVDVYTQPPVLAQMPLPIGRPIPVSFAPSRKSRLQVHVVKAEWQNFIPLES